MFPPQTERERVACSVHGVTQIGVGDLSKNPLRCADPLVQEALDRRFSICAQEKGVRTLCRVYTGPLIPDRQLENIIWMRYVDLDTVHPDVWNVSAITTSSELAMERDENDDGDGRIRLVSKTPRKAIDSFESWIHCWSLIVKVYMRIYPTIVFSLKKHEDVIVDKAVRFDWPAVYEFDKARRWEWANDLQVPLDTYSSFATMHFLTHNHHHVKEEDDDGSNNRSGGSGGRADDRRALASEAGYDNQDLLAVATKFQGSFRNYSKDVADQRGGLLKRSGWALFELADEEKFRGEDGTPREVETRGVRAGYGIFFLARDVKNSSFARGADEDFVVFSGQRGSRTGSGLYLTYKRRRSPVQHQQSAGRTALSAPWAAGILQAAQTGVARAATGSGRFGSLACQLPRCASVLARFTPSPAGVYLLALGTAGQLRNSLGIDNDVDDDDIVVKWGQTEIDERVRKHVADYGRIRGRKPWSS
ncbi:hypothetical protein HDU86_003455 [Geranomyces michiganensis]|nr:hypothetical protein HDU86_003455 [Geranomyces michiganensis]